MWYLLSMIKGHTVNLNDVILSPIQIDLDSIVKIMEEKIRAKKNIWILGNGGSASTSDHFETDLHFIRDSSSISYSGASSLCSNAALITAIGNDIGFENIFSLQLRRKSFPGDLIFLISASGNSKNLIKAIEFARINGVDSFGLLGFDGGKMINLVDNYLLVRSDIGQYGPVEDAHLAICHKIAYLVKERLLSA